jgi:hypothetical protein
LRYNTGKLTLIRICKVNLARAEKSPNVTTITVEVDDRVRILDEDMSDELDLDTILDGMPTEMRALATLYSQIVDDSGDG